MCKNVKSGIFEDVSTTSGCSPPFVPLDVSYYFARPMAYTLCHAMLTTMLAEPRVVGVHHAERCQAAFVT